MRINFQHAFLILMGVCTLATTGIAIRETVRNGASAARNPAAPTQLSEQVWNQLLGAGQRVGPEAAAVRLVEFADFQCPYCAQSQTDIEQLRSAYPNELAIYYLHYPLQGHQFAVAAAQASECAQRQGRFEQMQRTLYDNHSEFGRKPWMTLATQAGVPDTAAFESCMAEQMSPRIVAGKRLANEIGVRGTPTFVINGWMLRGLPSLDEFHAMIKRVKAGEPPVAGDL